MCRDTSKPIENIMTSSREAQPLTVSSRHQRSEGRSTRSLGAVICWDFFRYQFSRELSEQMVDILIEGHMYGQNRLDWSLLGSII